MPDWTPDPPPDHFILPVCHLQNIPTESAEPKMCCYYWFVNLVVSGHKTNVHNYTMYNVVYCIDQFEHSKY